MSVNFVFTGKDDFNKISRKMLDVHSKSLKKAHEEVFDRGIALKAIAKGVKDVYKIRDANKLLAKANRKADRTHRTVGKGTAMLTMYTYEAKGKKPQLRLNYFNLQPSKPWVRKRQGNKIKVKHDHPFYRNDNARYYTADVRPPVNTPITYIDKGIRKQVKALNGAKPFLARLQKKGRRSKLLGVYTHGPDFKRYHYQMPKGRPGKKSQWGPENDMVVFRALHSLRSDYSLPQIVDDNKVKDRCVPIINDAIESAFAKALNEEMSKNA